jgi:hypothetical protein
MPQLVVFCFAIGHSVRPLRRNPSTLLHAMQGRIKRPLLHAQNFFGGTLDVEHNPVSMQRPHLRAGLQNQQIQCSLQIILGHVRYLDNPALREPNPRYLGDQPLIFF